MKNQSLYLSQMLSEISKKNIVKTFFKGFLTRLYAKLTDIKSSMIKDNSTMYKTEAQRVSYGILYLDPSSHQCQPSYKKYIAV